MRALAAASVCLGLTASSASTAQAEEPAWRLGLALGYASLSRDEQPPQHGVGSALQGRYALNDALELYAELETSAYPEGDLVYGASTGLVYLVDVSRFVPTVGLGVGVVDVVTLSCPPTPLEDGSEGPPRAECGHDLRPTLRVPFGFGYRLLPELVVGLAGSYAFLLGSPATAQLMLGAQAGLVF